MTSRTRCCFFAPTRPVSLPGRRSLSTADTPGSLSSRASSVADPTYEKESRVSVSVPLTVDVTDAAGIGVEAHTAVTVVLPEPELLGDTPIVCFALPGAGYSRQYYTFDMP